MAGITRTEALDIIAHHFISNAVQAAIDGDVISRADYPDFREKDYKAVGERAQQIISDHLTREGSTEYEAAHAYFVNRAETASQQ